MFCPQCGVQLPDDARFCAKCGFAFSSVAETAKTPAPNPEPAPAAAPVPESAVEPQLEQSAPQVLEAAMPANMPEQSAAPAFAAAVPVASVPQAPMPPAVAGPAVAAAAPTAPAAKKSKAPLIAVAVVVVAAIVGVGAYFGMFAPYSIDEKTFPDASLRVAIAEKVDKDGDGKITRDEAKQVESLNLSGSGIESVEGLQLFENLHVLDVSGCTSLVSADFSKLKSLESILAQKSGLESLDVSALGNLTSIRADGSAITSLDVSANKKLTALQVGEKVSVTGVENTGVHAVYPVKKVTSTGIHGAIDMQGGDGGGNYVYEYGYDAHANLTSYKQTMTNTYDNKTYTTTVKYAYDYSKGEGQMKSGESTSGSNTVKMELTHDDAGVLEKVRSESRSSNSTSVSTYTITRDDDGHLTELKNEYSGSSSTTTRYLYAYNDAGQLVSAESIFSSSSNKTELVYDSAGRIADVKSNYAEYVYNYNDAGQLASRDIYWLNNGARGDYGTHVDISYDENGRPYYAKRTNTANDKYYLESMVAYDELGRISKIERLSHSEYDGKVTENDGTDVFEYTRLFVKNGVEITQPMLVGDPSHVMYNNRPLRFDVIGASKYDPIAALSATDMIYGILYL